jgi:hypothetical protein
LRTRGAVDNVFKPGRRVVASNGIGAGASVGRVFGFEERDGVADLDLRNGSGACNGGPTCLLDPRKLVTIGIYALRYDSELPPLIAVIDLLDFGFCLRVFSLVFPLPGYLNFRLPTAN